LRTAAKRCAKAVGECDRQGHQLRRLARGIAEHHSLVAGSRAVELVVAGGLLARLIGAVHALGDVGRLLVQGVEHGTRVGAEAQPGVDVADLPDRLARDVLDIEAGIGGDLARDHHQAGVDQRFAGHPAVGILGQDGVEDGVGDLVGDLVGMAFGDRFRGEQELAGGGWHRRGQVTRKPRLTGSRGP
jgi:hypothetical protein